MGTVDERLMRVFQTVQAAVPVPVIVTTRGPPTQATLAAAIQAGAGSARIVSLLGNAYAASATAEVAQRVAALPDTIGVFYDEPITAAQR